MSSTNLKLYSIIFIDSLCLSFLPPIMATHMMSFGAKHTTVGFLASIHAASQLISRPLIHSWTGLNGHKMSLLLSSIIYLLSYYFLGMTLSCFEFILLRMCFAVTNQTPSLCRNIANAINPSEVAERVNNLLNIFGVTGLIIGPTIGGFLYEYYGFPYISLLASSLLILSICLSITLPSPQISSTDSDTSRLSIKQVIVEIFNNVRTVSNKKHRVLFFLKVYYAIALTVFFMKFSFALRLNQGISFTTVGLTYSYQSLVTFLCTFVVNYFNTPENKKSFLGWLFTVGITLCILSNTNSYYLYLGSFIVMAIAHGIVTRLIRELYTANNMDQVEDSLTQFVSFTIPTVFGIACDSYGLLAFNAFVLIPIICDIVIGFIYLRLGSIENNSETVEQEQKKVE